MPCQPLGCPCRIPSFLRGHGLSKEGPYSGHCLHCVLEGQCSLSHRLPKVPVYSFASIFYYTFRKKGGVGGDVYGTKVDRGSFQVPELQKNGAGMHQGFCRNAYNPRGAAKGQDVSSCPFAFFMCLLRMSADFM